MLSLGNSWAPLNSPWSLKEVGHREECIPLTTGERESQRGYMMVSLFRPPFHSHPFAPWPHAAQAPALCRVIQGAGRRLPAGVGAVPTLPQALGVLPRTHRRSASSLPLWRETAVPAPRERDQDHAAFLSGDDVMTVPRWVSSAAMKSECRERKCGRDWKAQCPAGAQGREAVQCPAGTRPMGSNCSSLRMTYKRLFFLLVSVNSYLLLAHKYLFNGLALTR